MKIKEEHFNLIQEKFFIARVDIIKHKEYLLSIKDKPGAPKDLNKRLRWDVMNKLIGSKWICDNIYPYANDEHLDTVLKKVMVLIKVISE